MNPLLLKLGFSVIFAAVACVVAYGLQRRQQPYIQQYHSRQFDDSFITNCSICLEQLSSLNEQPLLKLPCGHKFHGECIKRFFSQESQAMNCPLCRSKVPSNFVSGVLKNSYL